MRLREFDLVPNQQSLQELLSRLLAMERDDSPETLPTKLLRSIEVRRGRIEPLQD